MDKETSKENISYLQTTEISPRYLLKLIKPILSEELVATYRFDREGLRIAFPNGQKFLLKIEEL